MPTHIHTSKKLERILKMHISKEASGEPGIIGRWNATVFYVQRKKCLMITNSPSRYSLLMLDFTAKDAANFSKHFKEAFFTQLTYDAVIMNPEEIEALVGEVLLLPTNNDRAVIGTQNYNISTFEYFWKHEFGSLENMPVNDLANRLNTSPYKPGKGREWIRPIQEMHMLLERV